MDDSVSLSPHDPSWASFFACERAALLAATGSTIVAIEHVGSSAVPQLVSRRCIDILVGIRSCRKSRRLDRILEGLGYQSLDQRPGQIQRFVRLDEHRDVAYQIYLVTVDGPEWRHYLTVRDYLICHPDEARRYGLLKEVIAPWGRDLYRKAKRQFFCSILDGTEDVTGRWPAIMRRD